MTKSFKPTFTITNRITAGLTRLPVPPACRGRDADRDTADRHRAAQGFSGGRDPVRPACAAAQHGRQGPGCARWAVAP